MGYADGYLSEVVTWNDIMPVVEKIGRLKGVRTVIYNNCMEIYFYGKDILGKQSSVKIESIFIGIIEFIKFCNTVKNTNKAIQ